MQIIKTVHSITRVNIYCESSVFALTHLSLFFYFFHFLLHHIFEKYLFSTLLIILSFLLLLLLFQKGLPLLLLIFPSLVLPLFGLQHLFVLKLGLKQCLLLLASLFLLWVVLSFGGLGLIIHQSRTDFRLIYF